MLVHCDKKQNYYTIELGHSEAMEMWRETVKACCEENTEGGCKECNCKAFDPDWEPDWDDRDD